MVQLNSIELPGFPGGLDNRAAPFALPDGCARNLVNVDVRAGGKVQRRQGYERLVAIAGAHSLYSNGAATLFVAAGNLYRLLGSGHELLIPGWGDRPTCYVDRAGEVFFSNGVSSARWKDGGVHNWGVPMPPFQPSLLPLPTGGLFGGIYQVVITWRDVFGVESGADVAVSVDVPEGGGLMLSDFPAPPPNIDQVSVYVSGHNGAELHWDSDYPAFTTSLVLEPRTRTVPLKTQFMRPMPPVDLLTMQASRLYGAKDDVLYYTSPYNPYLIDGMDGLRFSGPITCVTAVVDGVYVATEQKSYFVTALDQDAPPVRRDIANMGAVPGAVAGDPLLPGVLWLGEKGLMRGLPGGEVQNLTEAHVALPKAQHGAMTVREMDGDRFAIVSTWGCSPNPLVSSDWAARETARKGHAF